MRILIVDDSPTALLHTRFYLEEASEAHDLTVDIETATDGEQALVMAAQQPLDLVVLDIQLPGINGFDVCQALKRDYAHCRVAFVSGAADEQTLARARAAQGDFFIQKPINAGSFNNILCR